MYIKHRGGTKDNARLITDMDMMLRSPDPNMRELGKDVQLALDGHISRYAGNLGANISEVMRRNAERRTKSDGAML